MCTGGIYGYGYIHGYPPEICGYMDMDINAKFHIHGKPGILGLWFLQDRGSSMLEVKSTGLCGHTATESGRNGNKAVAGAAS